MRRGKLRTARYQHICCWCWRVFLTHRRWAKFCSNVCMAESKVVSVDGVRSR